MDGTSSSLESKAAFARLIEDTAEFLIFADPEVFLVSAACGADSAVPSLVKNPVTFPASAFAFLFI
jgi:hypothetical protein